MGQVLRDGDKFGLVHEFMFMQCSIMRYAVYIVASEDQGTNYIGVTNNIARRIWEHKQGAIDCFTKKYAVNRLVYVEWFDNIEAAIKREKQLKAWKRAWKIALIETDNPHWRDLYFDLCP